MKFLLKNGVVLKKAVAVVSELMQSVAFKFNHEGLHFSGMDSSHVAMVVVNINKSLFDVYDLPEGEVHVGLGLKSLNSILKLVGEKDQLQIIYNESKNCVLNVQFANVQKKRNYDFDLKLIDIDNDELQVPEMDFTHGLNLMAVDFAQMINDCVVFGDTVKIAIGDEKLVTSVEGETANSFMSLDGERNLSNDGDPVSMKLALRYLQIFSKGKEVSKKVIIRTLEGVPLEVTYPIDEAGKSSIVFYLAPKIEDDE